MEGSCEKCSAPLGPRARVCLQCGATRVPSVSEDAVQGASIEVGGTVGKIETASPVEAELPVATQEEGAEPSPLKLESSVGPETIVTETVYIEVADSPHHAQAGIAAPSGNEEFVFSGLIEILKEHVAAQVSYPKAQPWINIYVDAPPTETTKVKNLLSVMRSEGAIDNVDTAGSAIFITFESGRPAYRKFYESDFHQLFLVKDAVEDFGNFKDCHIDFGTDSRAAAIFISRLIVDFYGYDKSSAIKFEKLFWPDYERHHQGSFINSTDDDIGREAGLGDTLGTTVRVLSASEDAVHDAPIEVAGTVEEIDTTSPAEGVLPVASPEEEAEPSPPNLKMSHVKSVNFRNHLGLSVTFLLICIVVLFYLDFERSCLIGCYESVTAASPVLANENSDDIISDSRNDKLDRILAPDKSISNTFEEKKELTVAAEIPAITQTGTVAENSAADQTGTVAENSGADQTGAVAENSGADQAGTVAENSAAAQMGAANDRSISTATVDATGSLSQSEPAKISANNNDVPSRNYNVLRSSESRGPVPRASPASWLKISDLPERILQKGLQLSIPYTLSIDTSGRVVGCRAYLESSNELTEIFCRNVLKRAKFEPAHYRNNKLAPGEYRSIMRINLPALRRKYQSICIEPSAVDLLGTLC